MEQIAIISFKNSHGTQSRSGMSRVMNYCKRADKTAWQDHQLVSGVNCHPQSVYDDFLRTKLSYHKDEGRLYYHMVQSFPKGADIDPEVAHTAALRLAEWYKGREVLVCTHTDREHIHSHFIINSVSFEDGRKLHLGSKELESIQRLNDQVCRKFGLPVFERPQEQKAKSISYGEYHAAAKGQSWKFQLINTIDLCMRKARTKKRFVEEMEKRGYQVRWEKNRKAITYTTPTGMRCRDDRLHDKKYMKEVMEREFRIREQMLTRRIEAEELARRAAAPGDLSLTGAVDGADGYSGQSVSGHGPTAQPDIGARQVDKRNLLGSAYDAKADGETGEGSVYDPSGGGTGWEQERALAFSSAQNQTPGVSPTRTQGAGHYTDDIGGVGRSLLRLGYQLEQSGQVLSGPAPVIGHSDQKSLSKERQKKIAQGHKPDDRENPQQQMM